jgi:hypothetical protein
MSFVQVERYKKVREKVRAGHRRGEDVDHFEAELDSLWAAMSDADRRMLLGVGEVEKRAA